MNIRCILILFLLLQALTRLSAQDPYLMSLAEMQSGNYSEALAHLDEIIRPDKKNLAAYLKRAETLYLLDRFEEAINDLKIANSINKDCGEFLMARCYARLGQKKEAVTSLENHLLSGYKKPRTEILLDDAFRHLENSSEWKELWKKDWYSPEEEQKAEILYTIKSGELLEALEQTDNLIKESPRNHELHAIRAGILEKMGQEQAALNAWTSTIQISGRHESYLSARAELYMRSEEFNSAVSDYSRAIEILPEKFELFLMRSLANQMNGNYQASLNDINTYLLYFPEDAEAIYQCGLLHSYFSYHLRALEQFNHCLAIDPSQARFYRGRAYSYMKTSTYKYAIADYSMALDLDPFHADSYLQKGLARLASGDKDGACSDWKMAVHYGSEKAKEYLLDKCASKDK